MPVIPVMRAFLWIVTGVSVESSIITAPSKIYFGLLRGKSQRNGLQELQEFFLALFAAIVDTHGNQAFPRSLRTRKSIGYVTANY